MNLLEATKPEFRRHDGFAPRYGWFRKAYSSADLDPYAFSDKDAAVLFGVGINMVNGIRTWGLATEILQEQPSLLSANPTRHIPTQFGHELLGKRGWDPFIEDLGTLWLLHWRIMAPRSRLPVWWLAFNDFEDTEFSKDELTKTVTKKLTDTPWHLPSPNTIEREVNTLLLTYAPSRKSKRPWLVKFEDFLESPLRKLELIQHSDTKDYYRFNLEPKPSLPPAILCHAALDFASRSPLRSASISLASLLEEPGAPGKAFKIGEEELCHSLKRAARSLNSVRVDNLDGEPHLFWSDSPRHSASEILDALYGHSKTDNRHRLSETISASRSPQLRKIAPTCGYGTRSASPHAALNAENHELDWQALIAHLKDVREPQPEVASRHSAEYDLIRVFSFEYALSNDPVPPLDPASPYDGKVLLVIGPNPEPPPLPPGSSVAKPTLAAIPEDLAPLKTAARQVVSLTKENKIKTSPRNAQELAAKQGELRRVVGEAFKPENCRWVLLDPMRNKELPPGRRSEALSTAADIAYPSTPRFENEMLNAWPQLTPQGQRTQRKLIRAMIEQGDQPDLGFTGYGPEVAMYRSVLHRTGLHRRDEQTKTMNFTRPPGASLRPAWQLIDSAATACPAAGRPQGRASLDELHMLLLSPPVGMRKAAIAVFLTAWMLAQGDRLKIFSSEREIPLDGETALTMAKHPERFELELSALDPSH